MVAAGVIVAPATLGRDDEAVAPAVASEPAAEDLLGAAHQVTAAAERIDVGRIEEGDAARDRAVEDVVRRRLLRLRAEDHRPKADS